MSPTLLADRHYVCTMDEKMLSKDQSGVKILLHISNKLSIFNKTHPWPLTAAA